ncbi:MAG TPA: 16S rRNA (guanine(527)-N(7))-methyltransferase RsmG [Nitrospiraceae bacterium]|nr:16S rRNA (guanine(527)-N(7))-methyltransferase RsmG [Nitrospiraceae bacterium]
MEHQQDLRKFMLAGAESIGLSLTTTHVDQFMTYIAELRRWNKKINLTGIDTPKDIIVKHFLDSLAALKICNFPLKSILIDIGSGAGFPGIPLKILREDLQLVLVEPVHKKSSFLKSVIGLLKFAHVSTFDGTIQEYGKSPDKTLANFLVVRALKLNEIMSFTTELLAKGGQVILYRTESIDSAEIHNDFALYKELSFDLPYEYGHRVISIIEAKRPA